MQYCPVVMADNEPSSSDRAVAGAIAAVGSYALTKDALASALITAATTPYVETAAATVRAGAQSRIDRATNAVKVAIHFGGVTPDQFLSNVRSSDKKLEFALGALNAAAASVEDYRVAAIGRALATGALAADEAIVDEQTLYVRAFAACDALHVRLLTLISHDVTDPEGREQWTDDQRDELSAAWWRADIERVDPGLAVALDNLTSTLTGQGLVRDIGIGRLDYQPFWQVTEFGHKCLGELQRRGQVQTDPPSCSDANRPTPGPN